MKLNSATLDYLMRVAARAIQEQRPDVAQWINKHLAQEERAARGKRPRKAHVRNPVTGKVMCGKSGEVWIDPALLREIEASARLDKGEDGRSVTQSEEVSDD